MEHKKLNLTIVKLESGYVVSAKRTNVTLTAFNMQLDFEHAHAEGNKDGVHASVKDAVDYFLDVTEPQTSENSKGKNGKGKNGKD